MAFETVSASREHRYPRAVVDLRPDFVADFVPGTVIGASGGLVLRFARDDDAAAIIALISAVWSEYPGKTLVAAADMPELLRPASAYAACDGRFWVVEANGSIIGTIALAPSKEPGIVELQKLYVAREMRQNGLGGFLCRLVEQEARQRGAQAIELWSDVKLLDAHRRYERLGYIRGETLKTYDDTSGTVRYYYRKPLDPELTDHPDDLPEAGNPWQALLRIGGTSDASLGNGIMQRLSFTAHPASVGESYLQHLRHAAGFAASMISGGLAVLVHAVLPFLFVKTGSEIIADLNMRMITNRRRQIVRRSTGKRTGKSAGANRDERASAA
jgi:putative acetyltransferase